MTTFFPTGSTVTGSSTALLILWLVPNRSVVALWLSVYIFRHYPTSILCLQGLCRILFAYHSEKRFVLGASPPESNRSYQPLPPENTAGRSRSVLNRIILAANNKGGCQMQKRITERFYSFLSRHDRNRTGDIIKSTGVRNDFSVLPLNYVPKL